MISIKNKLINQKEQQKKSILLKLKKIILLSTRNLNKKKSILNINPKNFRQSLSIF